MANLGWCIGGTPDRQYCYECLFVIALAKCLDTTLLQGEYAQAPTIPTGRVAHRFILGQKNKYLKQTDGRGMSKWCQFYIFLSIGFHTPIIQASDPLRIASVELPQSRILDEIFTLNLKMIYFRINAACCRHIRLWFPYFTQQWVFSRVWIYFRKKT